MQNLAYTQTHYLVALAQEYRSRGFDVTYQPFSYAADWLPLHASQTETRTVTIEHDSDFVWCGQSFTAFQAGAPLTNPNILARIISDTAQREFQNQQGHLLNLFGTGQRPFLWPKPPVFTAKSTFTIELQDLSAVDTNVRLSFIGTKAFMVPAS